MTWPPDPRARQSEGRIAMPGRVAVKVCGVTRAEDARLAAALGASAVGFVFWRRSPRALPVEAAAAIVRELPPFVAAVGVFVNQPIAEVMETARRVPLDIVQLHGDEPPEYVAAVPGRILKAVPAARIDRAREAWASPRGAARPVRAFGTGDRATATGAANGDGVAQPGDGDASGQEAPVEAGVPGPPKEGDTAGALGWPPRVVPLVDAADPVRRGGTGRTADWELARRLASVRPVVLAGGLDADNVCRAVERVRPWAVDVSSGVEARPGVKDPDRLRAFFASLEAAGLLARGGPAVPWASESAERGSLAAMWSDRPGPCDPAAG
jgi:phosphoribosylanthranilate isomerase